MEEIGLVSMSFLAVSVFGVLSSLLLIGFLLLPVCAWFLSRVFAMSRWGWWGIFLGAVVFGSVLYIGAVWAVEMESAAEVETFRSGWGWCGFRAGAKPGGGGFDAEVRGGYGLEFRDAGGGAGSAFVGEF
jgi:hypothetical protein